MMKQLIALLLVASSVQLGAEEINYIKMLPDESLIKKAYIQQKNTLANPDLIKRNPELSESISALNDGIHIIMTIKAQLSGKNEIAQVPFDSSKHKANSHANAIIDHLLQSSINDERKNLLLSQLLGNVLIKGKLFNPIMVLTFHHMQADKATLIEAVGRESELVLNFVLNQLKGQS